MKYVFKLIQGEKNLNEFIQRMKGKDAHVRFMESTGHCDDVHVRRFYMKPQGEDYHKVFFLLYMEHKKGWTGDVNAMQLACHLLVEKEDTRVTTILQMKKNAPDHYNRLVELKKHIQYDKK